MKRITRISLRVAGILLAIGLVIGGVGLLIAKGDFSKISNLKATKRTVEVEPFTSLSVEAYSSDVKLLPSADGKGRVELKESDLLYHTVDVVDGALTVKEKDTRKWYQCIGFSFAEMEVTVYLPEGEYSALQVSTASGDIYLSACGSNAKVSLKASSGEITVKDTALQSLTAKVSSGEAEFKSLTVAENIAVELSSGDLELRDTSCKALTAATNSGEVEIGAVRCDRVDVSVSSGNVRLKDVISTGESKLRASSGNIRLTACDAGSYDLKTGSGNIKGSVLTEKSFDAQAGSGSVKVPTGTSGGVCKARTSSGDIHLTLYAE